MSRTRVDIAGQSSLLVRMATTRSEWTDDEDDGYTREASGLGRMDLPMKSVQAASLVVNGEPGP
jgi:hypothetical protein